MQLILLRHLMQRRAILTIDVQYWEAKLSNPGHKDIGKGGTTALVAVVWGNTLYVSNTGELEAAANVHTPHQTSGDKSNLLTVPAKC